MMDLMMMMMMMMMPRAAVVVGYVLLPDEASVVNDRPLNHLFVLRIQEGMWSHRHRHRRRPSSIVVLSDEVDRFNISSLVVVSMKGARVSKIDAALRRTIKKWCVSADFIEVFVVLRWTVQYYGILTR
jgi:hypothetical protein